MSKDKPELSQKDWPAWFYGPAGEAEIFNSPDDVPDGWKDHPAPLIDL